MHELSLAQALIEQAERIRAEHGAESVASITVNIGALSGVDRQSFEFAFPMAAAETALCGARLRIEETPAQALCEDCRARSQPEPAFVVCAACGSRRVRITAGRDFLLTAVELNGV